MVPVAAAATQEQETPLVFTTEFDEPHAMAMSLADEPAPIIPLQLPGLDVPYFPTQLMEIATISDADVHYMRLYDFQRANRAGKQALGFILPPGASFRVRQVNPSFVGDTWWMNFNTNRPTPSGNLGLDLFSHVGASRTQNIQIPGNGNWVVITGVSGANARYTVPFIRTPFAIPGSPNPIIEFEILPNVPILPIYDYTDSRSWIPGVNDDFTTYAAWDAWDTPEARLAHEAFIASWTDQPYAVIRGYSVQLFASIHDRFLPVVIHGPNYADTGIPFWSGTWDAIADLRHFVNLDQVLGYYDHMLAVFDYWAGLDPSHQRLSQFQVWDAAEFNDTDPRHSAPSNSIFAAPHVGGAGAGYWTGTHMGQSSGTTGTLNNPVGSIERFYIRRSWGSLHEVGHGYQGTHFRGNLGEVWTNLYSHFYQERYILPTHPLVPFPWHDPAFEGMPGWIGGGLEASRAQMRYNHANHINTIGDGMHYGVFSSIFFDSNCNQHNFGAPQNLGAFRGRHNAEPRFHNLRVNLGVPYHVSNDPYLAYFYIILFEAVGMDEGYRAFNRLYREWFAVNYQGTRSWSNYNVHALLFSLVSGLNFVPYFEAYGVNISDTVRNQVSHLPSMLILYDMVECAETRANLVAEHGLISEFSLIRADLLADANIPAYLEYTIAIDDINQIMGKYVYLMAGAVEVDRQPITGNVVRFENIPIGAYTAYFPYSNYRAYIVPRDSVTVRGGSNTRTVTYGQILPEMMSQQVINLHGLEDRLFGTVTIDTVSNEVRIQGLLTTPSSPHGATNHATVTILNSDDEIVHVRPFVANAAAEANAAINDTVSIQPGYTVRVHHANNVAANAHNRVITMNAFFGVRTHLDTRTATQNFLITEFGLQLAGQPPQSADSAAAAFFAMIVSYASSVSAAISAENRENFRTFADERNKLFAAIMQVDESQRMVVAGPVMDVMYPPWREILELFRFDTLTALQVFSYPDNNLLALNPVFEPAVNLYAITVASDVESVNILAGVEAGITLSGDLGVQALNFGTNTFVVTVGTAVLNHYTIVVTRPSTDTGFVSDRTAAVPTITRQPLNQSTQVNMGVTLSVDYMLHGLGTTTVEWFEAANATTYGGSPVGSGNLLSLIPRNPGVRFFYAQITNYNPDLTGSDPVDTVRVRTGIVAVETTAVPTVKVADIANRFDSYVVGNAIFAITNEASFPVELSVSAGATWTMFSDPGLTSSIVSRTLHFDGNYNQRAYVLVENGGESAVYVLSVTRQNIVLPDTPQGWSVEQSPWGAPAEARSHGFEAVGSSVVIVDFDLTTQHNAAIDVIIAFSGTGGAPANPGNNNSMGGHLRIQNPATGWRMDGFDTDRSIADANPHGTGVTGFTGVAGNGAPGNFHYLPSYGPMPVRVALDLATQRYQAYVNGQPVNTQQVANWRPLTDQSIIDSATDGWMRFRNHHGAGTTFAPRIISDITRVYIAGGSLPAHQGTLSIDNFRITESSARYEVIDVPVILLQPDGTLWIENGSVVYFTMPLTLNASVTIDALGLPTNTGNFTIFDFETITIPRVTRATVITARAIDGGDVQPTPAAEINFFDETLTGLAPNAVFSITVDSAAAFFVADATGHIAIDENWMGETINIVRRGDGTQGLIDSLPQVLPIPARPAEPTGLASTPGTGTITGITTAMEYREGDETPWTAVTNPDAIFAFGMIQVRIAATASGFASNSVDVAVSPGGPAVSVSSTTTYSAVLDLGTPAANVSHVITFTHNGTVRTMTTAPGATHVRVLPLSLNTAYTLEVRSSIDGALSSPVSVQIQTLDHPPHRLINFDWAEPGEVVGNSYALSTGDRILADGTLGGRPGFISGETPNLNGPFQPGVTINANAQFHRVVETNDGGNALRLVSASTANRHIAQYHFPPITNGVFEVSYRTRTLQGQFNAIELLGTIDGVGDNIPVITVVQFSETANLHNYAFEISNINPPHTGTQGEQRPGAGVMSNLEDGWVYVRMIIDLDNQYATVLINDELLVDREAFRYRVANGSLTAAPRFPAEAYTAITGFQMRPQNGGAAVFDLTDVFVTPQMLQGDILFNNALDSGTETVTATFNGRHIGDLTFT